MEELLKELRDVCEKHGMVVVMEYSMEEELSMFDAWKAKGCPSVEKVNKMIW